MDSDDYEVDVFRKEKQDYLNREVIENGFIPSEFQEFLESIKENGGTNIDLWTLEELKELTRKFKENHMEYKNEISSMEDLNLDENKPMRTEENLVEKKEEVSKEQKEAPIVIKEKKETESFNKSINCIILDPTPLSNHNVKVSIIDFQIIPGGIFYSAYALFTIGLELSSNKKITVQRRYSDFFLLRNFFTKVFPGILVPPIPTKKVTRNVDPAYLTKRRTFLEKFLTDCLDSPSLRNSKVLYDFLSVQDENKFKQIKDIMTNAKKPDNLGDFRSINGQINLKINEELTKYTQYSTEYLTNAEALYDKIKKLHKQLIKDFDNVSTTLFSIGEAFTLLHKNSNNLNSKIDKKSNLFDDVYIYLNNMYIKWGNTLTKQIQLITDDLSSFFKYERKCLTNAVELAKERNFYSNEYYRAVNNLEKKKFYENSQRDVKKLTVDVKDKFTSIFQKEVNIDLLKDWFAYYNYSFAKEIQNLLQDKCQKFLKHFVTFGNLQTNIIKENHEIWAEIISHFGDAIS